MGTWETIPWVAILASLSIVITAAYILIVVRRVFFGDMPTEFEGHISPISALDKIAIVTLCFVMVALGIFPWLMVPMVQSGVQNIMSLLGGA